ncbi:5-oxoprolinase subunit PxpA [Constantimarinum furrinae]|uniref:LamB/YcsF family protein n=1 Tax=Constantimarinum furrinae TaxID=2562285 RepID=A0A7G8PXF6_9FLAO|nr:5-oxoprolinase subunit PxpA [Constantimarinum furrinae]QNJ99022.1 LamB/YcsF family protein [Constantimarinum furrinae]
MVIEIDINADLGEGMGQDEALMPLISSCSIACGGHYGTDESMRRTVILAKKHKVKVGAHPSFPDRDNFGRKVMSLSKQELSEAVYYQLLHFYAVCETEGVTVNHIKLHGALYNYAAIDAPAADAVVEAIVETKIRPKLYLPYGSILHKKAENIIPLQFEAFIDRTYNNDLRLVSRSDPNATIETAEAAWKQLQGMIFKNEVTTSEGLQRNIVASTYCIHGDNPNALVILDHIHSQLHNAGIQLL